MLTHNGIIYPAQMPAQVVILAGPHCDVHGWTPGAVKPVEPTYHQDQYEHGGHYVNVKSDAWGHGIPLAPGQYKPAA